MLLGHVSMHFHTSEERPIDIRRRGIPATRSPSRVRTSDDAAHGNNDSRDSNTDDGANTKTIIVVGTAPRSILGDGGGRGR
jgi:hypothetical protein